MKKQQAAPAPGIAGAMTRLLEAGYQLVREWNDRAFGWPGMLAGAAGQALKPGSTVIAAAIAYFSLFSLFPLILLSISIVSYTLDPAAGQQYIVQKLEFITPALGILLGQNINEIIRARGPVTWFALIGLIWSASTIFYTFTQTLNDIWGNKKRRPVWKRRGLAILFVLTVVGPVLFLASFIGSLFANLRTWLPAEMLSVGDSLGYLVAIASDVSLFMVLYMLLPHGASTWREVLPGAVGAGLLWELAKKGFLLLVSAYTSASNLIYGSVAAIIAFLAWAYLSGIIFHFGAYLSVAYYRQKQGSQEVGGEIALRGTPADENNLNRPSGSHKVPGARC